MRLQVTIIRSMQAIALRMHVKPDKSFGFGNKIAVLSSTRFAADWVGPACKFLGGLAPILPLGTAQKLDIWHSRPPGEQQPNQSRRDWEASALLSKVLQHHQRANHHGIKVSTRKPRLSPLHKRRTGSATGGSRLAHSSRQAATVVACEPSRS